MWPAWDSSSDQGTALMNPDAHAPLMLVLLRHSPGGRLAVDLQSFLDFNAQMDNRLAELERTWAAFRTPASVRRGALRQATRRLPKH